MGLLSEVLKLSPWHIQWGGAERNAFVNVFVYLRVTSGRGGAYNLTELRVHVRAYVVVRWTILHTSPSSSFSLFSLQMAIPL